MHIDRFFSKISPDWRSQQSFSESAAPPEFLPVYESVTELSNCEQYQLMLAISDRRDRDAFRKLFEFYAPRLTTFGLQSGLGLAAAEALSQETMLNVWRQAERCRPTGLVSAWIFLVLRSTRQDMVRRQPRQDFDASTSPAFPLDDRTAKSFCTPRVTVELCEAMAQLPSEDIEVVSRAFFKDMSEADIAADLDLSLDVIRLRMRRALTHLYPRLARDLTPWQ